MVLFSSATSEEAEEIKGLEIFDDFQMIESFEPSKPVVVVCGNGETFVGWFEGKDLVLRPVKIERGNEGA